VEDLIFVPFPSWRLSSRINFF